jgi:uncharacterized protein DUF6799
MKKLIVLMALTAVSWNLYAQQSDQKKDSIPDYYIMMRQGKMIEVSHGQKRQVEKRIILLNETTIHSNGVINVSSGRTKKLREGEYITMDGRIRKLRTIPPVIH